MNNFKVFYRFAFSLIFRLSGFFALQFFNCLVVFFCCLVFKVHSFFRCPLWFFYLAGLLVYITISFSVCQHLFLSFLSALSAFFSAVCFDAASPTSMVCSIYHIFFSLSILFFLYSFFFLFFFSSSLQVTFVGLVFFLTMSLYNQ